MTIGKLTTFSAALAFAFAFMACDAHTLIGTVPDASAPDDSGRVDRELPDVLVADGGHTCTPQTFPGDAPYTLPAGVAGSWTGYFQGGSPLTTSDVVKLSIQQAADGSGEIHVTMGTAPAPAPATSATDYYPPGGFTGIQASYTTIIEGFAYLAHAVTWQGTRLRLQIADAQPWEGWCALQTSYFVVARDQYNCIPGLGGGSSGGSMPEMCTASDGERSTPVACPQLFLCNNRTCACDSCGCSAKLDASSELFDVTFDGDLLTGVGAGHNVRLTRDAI